MPRQQIQTINCPGCGRTLPARVLKCHFCGNDLAFAGRPNEAPRQPDFGAKNLKMEKLYRGVAYYWVFDGFCTILVSMNLLPQWASGLGGALFEYLGFAATTGFLIGVLGLGMLFKVPMARWLVGAFCWFRVALGLLGIGVILRSGDYDVAKHNLYWLIFLNLIDTVFAGFQLWLLYETDYEVLN